MLTVSAGMGEPPATTAETGLAKKLLGQGRAGLLPSVSVGISLLEEEGLAFRTRIRKLRTFVTEPVSFLCFNLTLAWLRPCQTGIKNHHIIQKYPPQIFPVSRTHGRAKVNTSGYLGTVHPSSREEEQACICRQPADLL